MAAQVDSPSTAIRRYHLVGYYYTQNSQDHLLSVKAIRFDRLAKSDPLAAYCPSRYVCTTQYTYR
ncbi:MAG TPA: hypothetical protein VEI07_11000 [Planctomycetaceae bacterium]|nr:hypothetical protein [Planctomycetaceae bacterium]